MVSYKYWKHLFFQSILYSKSEYLVIMLKIVLTAPASELAEVGQNPAAAFVSAFPKPWFIPLIFIEKKLYKIPAIDDEFRLSRAPLGLRRIEASLIDIGGFRREDVGIIHPNHLDEVVNRDTRVVGVSVKDPLGLAYVSLTYSTLVGMGEPLNKHEFFRMTRKIMALKKKYGFKTVIGGPGVWQLMGFNDPYKLGYDVVVDGEGELVAPAVFRELVNGGRIAKIVKGNGVPVEKIPVIKGSTLYGAV